MKSRTGLFSLAVLGLMVPSAWMLIAAPGAPALEFAGHVRWGSSAALLPDGRMLIVGGADRAGPVSAAEILSNGSITSAAAMSIARAKAAAISLADGRVLVTGGVTAGGEILGSAEIYEAATNSWSTIPASLIEPRAGHTASLLPDGRVVLAGGETAGRISQSVELFDPSTGAFSFAGTLSMPRAGHTAAVLSDGRVLIAGGSFGGVAPSGSTDLLDPATKTISAGPELLTGRAGHTATTLLNGNVLILGGTNGLTDLDSAEIFDAATGTIQPASSLHSARSGHSAYLLASGDVLIVGGDVQAAELYSFETGTLSDTSRNQLTNTAGIPDASKTSTTKIAPTVLADTATTTISTDKTKYSVGEPMTIVGSGFTANGTVNISVLRTDRNTDTLSVTADGSGGFTTVYNPPLIPGRYKITATDGTNTATTAATEADAAAADLDQCRNGDASSPTNCVNAPGGEGWANGNAGTQDSHYVEGYSIPYRMTFTGVTAGTWTVDLGYDTVHSSKHAIDFLTHYDLINDPSHSLAFGHPSECIDPTDGFLGLPANNNDCALSGAPTSTFPIPKPIIPDSLAGNPPGTPPCSAAGGTVLGGATSCPGTTFDKIAGTVPAGTSNAFFSMWNGTITSVSYFSQNVVSGQGQQETRIRLVFTAVPGNSNVLLSWGGHIARRQDWGTGNSAGGLSGSPYHMRLIGFCSGTLPSGTACTDGGNQDRSLSADTVFSPGTIVIVKNTIGGDGPFAYTATGNGVSNFSLTTVSGTASQTFGGLVPGTKGGSRTFTETPIPNQFKLSSLTCTSASGTSTITTDLGTGLATVSSLGDGDTVTCTYTNTKVDANIQITPATAVNAVGTNHTLTITVNSVNTTLGSGTATASITSGPGSFVGSPTCSYTGGAATASCTVVITSATPGTTVVSATSSIPLTGGVSITRTTDGTAGNSGPASKTWADATIAITPATATNAVGTNHTLTTTVTAVGTTVGNGTATASITSGPGSFVGSPTCSYIGGGSTASCIFVITSAATGTTVVSSTSSIPLTGDGSVPRTTDGTAGNSNPASKTWVDATILINPPTATNNIGTNHTLTITVNSSGGNLDSGTATASITSGPGGFVGPPTCSYTGGGTTASCTVIITSLVAGTTTISATSNITVAGVVVTRSTDGTTTPSGLSNSNPAQKIWLDGHVQVLKTVDGNVPGANDPVFTFELRVGADINNAGRILQTLTTSAGNGALSFTPSLISGNVYQICELAMPGFSTSLTGFFGAFNPGASLPGTVCVNFTGQAGTVVVTVNNLRQGSLGDQLPRTIGFWKNWASCETSNGNQSAILDRTLQAFEPGGFTVGILTLHDTNSDPDVASDCGQVRNLLDKTAINGGRKLANDPLFNMAAQYVAYSLNVQKGATACWSPDLGGAAQALLAAHQFDGLTHTALNSAQAAYANALNSLLDTYNNTNGCPATLPAPPNPL